MFPLVFRGSVRLRASDLASLFEVYMLAVGLGALKTALDAHAPWFNETIAFWVYAMTFLGSVVVLSVTGTAAAFLPRIRISIVPNGASGSGGMERPGYSPGSIAEDDIDELLTSLEHGEKDRKTRSFVAEVKRVGPRTTMQVGRSPSSVGASSRRVQLTLLGPSLAAGSFCAMSAALLSGVAYLQAQFTFNTFAILTLSYGWGGLAFYTIASLFLAGRQA